MNKNETIIRVGSNYFYSPTLQLINRKEALKVCKSPQKYIGFTNVPYSCRNIEGYFNLHNPTTTRVTSNGSTETIENYLKSIFKEDYEKAIRYLFHLAWNTEKKLPVMNLYSNEQQTGKTTFLEFVRLLDFENSILMTKSDHFCSWNHFWAAKNIICIDEFEGKRYDILCSLITAKEIVVQQKYLASYFIPFHGSFIIASTKGYKFYSEQRFWDVPLSKIENPDPFLLEKLKAEIPAFMGKLLMNRTEICSSPSTNRLDF